MRVLLVNAFHWLKGGVERTYFDESRWLAAAGHEVAHFATRHDGNEPSPTAEYFAPPADFTEGGSTLAQLKQLPRVLWSAPAAAAMARLVAAWKPDVAHLHAPSRHLTPSILRPLERARVPVVMTLHDFKPWCTNRILFAHGEVCERCRGGRHWHAVTTACVQDSRAKSVVGSVEAYLHDALNAYRSVRRWIAPSRFVYDKARENGVDDARLRVLSHGVEPARGTLAPPDGTPERYALFAGRLSTEKGVRLLPAIAGAIRPTPLLVAGEGPLAGWLAANAPADLRLLGHLSDAALAGLRARAAAVIVPSLFVEHYGYTVAEALLDARPVIAAKIGALPELIEHEGTGLLVAPGDGPGFAAAVRRALDDPAAPRWGAAGRERVERMSAPAAHLAGLLGIYREALEAPATGEWR
ncbi:MAG: glycosyltransferase [Candidatus Eisenbacteria bacterium]|nr:glycosyltransferase [Candidatus Eisenbacteria bacterium]